MIDPEGRTSVALWVQVDDENTQPVQGQTGGHVDGSGGLTDAALLVRDRHDPRVLRTGGELAGAARGSRT